MNITITGASGLIGRRLLKNLGAAGHTLTVVSRHAGTNVPPGVGGGRLGSDERSGAGG